MTPQQNAFLSIAVPAAQHCMQQTGVPASVTIAQAIDESGWGAHAPGNNYFGIKATNLRDANSYVCCATHEFRHGVDVLEHDYFQRFATMQDCFLAHALLLSMAPRYLPAMQVKASASMFAQELQACGYATDPGYAAKLDALITEYDLTQYDCPAPAPATGAAPEPGELPVIHANAIPDWLAAMAFAAMVASPAALASWQDRKKKQETDPCD